jgi:thiamine biosynthesis lipoprotein
MMYIEKRSEGVSGGGDSAASFVRTAVSMDTIVSIEVVRPASASDCAAAVGRAFDWFSEVEGRCTRFDPQSETMRLCAHPGVVTEVSPLLFSVVEFALAVAEASSGAFDPTIGGSMSRHGFDRNYLTGERLPTSLRAEPSADYRDVLLDAENRTITLRQPLILDLGAVAKGLAVDLAAAELRRFEHFAINAGGDLYLAGHNRDDEPWRVGVRNPRQTDELLDTLQLSGVAVCTSGDYERVRPGDRAGHHILDPQTGDSTNAAASVTVVAPTAVVADALATAAFVLGPRRGIRLLEVQEVEGMIITPRLSISETHGFGSYRV